MTPEQKVKELKSKIVKYIEYWKNVLFMQGWTIVVVWDEQEAHGSARANRKYRQMRINFNLPAIIQNNYNNSELEELVVHELTHSMPWDVCRLAERSASDEYVDFLEEALTTDITSSLIRAREVGRTEGEKSRKGKSK